MENCGRAYEALNIKHEQMKRIFILALALLLSAKGFSQINYIWGIYAGGGTTTQYNYNIGISGGFEFMKYIGSRTYLGANLFYQGYAFLYDREAYNIGSGASIAGVTILHQSSYFFIAPKILHDLDRKGLLTAYVNVGPGFKMSGTETMRKWNNSNGYTATDYDSTINTTKNINSMVFRVGVGLIEYIHMNKTWWFTFTEDFGFLTSSLTKTSDVDDPSRTQYSPNGKLNPNFFSLQIGISHVKLRD